MTEQLARLGIKVDSRGVVQATRDLKTLEKQGGRTEKSTDKLSGSFSKMRGVVTALGLGLLAKEVLDTNRSFESLRASLETAAGGAENAEIAFAGIQEFASTTPYSLDEVTQAFIRLANLGLAPTEKALTSYGNIAGAMSKNIIDFVEAVADAATGEFERLKEFGIKASKEGDKVTFRFRGVETQVANSSQAIQDYLIGLGETEFAGGMERQANTLNGAISNLGDSWDKFIDNLLSSENQSKITEAVKFVTSGVEFLTDLLDGPGNSVAEVNRQLEFQREQLEKIRELQDTSRVGRISGVMGYAGVFASDETLNEAEQRLIEEIAASESKLAGVKAEIKANKSEFNNLAESLDTTTTSLGSNTKKLTEQEKAAEKLKKAYRDLTSDLSEQRTMLGLTEREAFIYEAQTKLSAQATKEMRDQVTELAGALFDEQQAYDKRNASMAEAEQIIESTLTAQERYLKQLEKIDELEDSGAFKDAPEAAARARQQAFKEMKGAAEETADDMTKFIERAAENMQDAMANGFFDIMQGNFSDLGDSFKQTIDRMIADLMASQLLNYLIGDFGNTGKFGGVIGNLLNNSVEARAEGGPIAAGQPYLVGERGPELVIPKQSGTVIPNGQTMGNSVSVYVNVNGIADSAGLRASAAQVAKQSAQAAQRALSRNG